MGRAEKLQRKAEEIEAKKAAETLKKFCESRTCEECIFLSSTQTDCKISSNRGPVLWSIEEENKNV